MNGLKPGDIVELQPVVEQEWWEHRDTWPQYVDGMLGVVIDTTGTDFVYVEFLLATQTRRDSFRQKDFKLRGQVEHAS